MRMDFLPKDPAILVSSVRSSSARLLPTGRKNVYIHSTLDWQKDDIELAIGSYVDDMSQVIGLPLRSSKNSMMPYPMAGLIFSVITSGLERISLRLLRD